MEIGLDVRMPTYSGGLGILAGDTVRAAADLDVPMVAVTLVHRRGYLYQKIDASGAQREAPAEWVVEDYLSEEPARAAVSIEGRDVIVRAWRFDVVGVHGFSVPVYLLDTDLPENATADRTLTHYLYGGDQRYRLSQEVVLGIGGVRMLRALGFSELERFHMNEGHASLLTLELLQEEVRKEARTSITCEDIEAVHDKCVFTTHTPVPVGHDQFSMQLVADVLGARDQFVDMKDVFCIDVVGRVLRQDIEWASKFGDLVRPGVNLNLTYLALNLSRYVNGVAKRHGEVSRHMFADYLIDSITNGVHTATWAAPPIAALFDRYIASWREDGSSLRYALAIPDDELWAAHQEAKRELVDYVNRQTNSGLELNAFTVGFARRMTGYKRPLLVFEDLNRLRRICKDVGNIQFVFGGKAHPRDQLGKKLIKRLHALREELHGEVRIAYVPNYDIRAAKLMTAGVDLWLNTPEPPREASGTSGMKAALNGVPSHSILDGWWMEGCVEGITGWAIGESRMQGESPNDRRLDALDLYDKWEQVVVPTYYGDRSAYVTVMRHALALNGSFFNTHRMIQQYVLKAYL